MAVKLEDYPVPEQDVVGQVVDGEAVLVFPSKGKVKVLNEVGARIWALADGKRSIGDIATQITKEYEVDISQAQQEALGFIQELVDKDVMRIANIGL
jgi:hypothetical protein